MICCLELAALLAWALDLEAMFCAEGPQPRLFGAGFYDHPVHQSCAVRAGRVARRLPFQGCFTPLALMALSAGCDKPWVISGHRLLYAKASSRSGRKWLSVQAAPLTWKSVPRLPLTSPRMSQGVGGITGAVLLQCERLRVWLGLKCEHWLGQFWVDSQPHCMKAMRALHFVTPAIIMSNATQKRRLGLEENIPFLDCLSARSEGSSCRASLTFFDCQLGMGRTVLGNSCGFKFNAREGVWTKTVEWPGPKHASTPGTSTCRGT